MSQESMENLGFTEENSPQTEDDRKKELAAKFLKFSNDAKSTVENYYKEQYIQFLFSFG